MATFTVIACETSTEMGQISSVPPARSIRDGAEATTLRRRLTLRLGPDHETASGRSRHEAGAGAPSSRVGPMNMVAGALLAAVGIGASVASYHSIIELDAPLAFVFYGTIFVGGVEFAYGILRSLDG